MLRCSTYLAVCIRHNLQCTGKQWKVEVGCAHQIQDLRWDRCNLALSTHANIRGGWAKPLQHVQEHPVVQKLGLQGLLNHQIRVCTVALCAAGMRDACERLLGFDHSQQRLKYLMLGLDAAGLGVEHPAYDCVFEVHDEGLRKASNKHSE